MAGKKKTSKEDMSVSEDIDKVVDEIADAVAVEDEAADPADDQPQEAEAIELSEPDESTDAPVEPAEDDAPDAADDQPDDQDEPTEDTPEVHEPAPVEVQQTVIRQGGFWSMLLGGVAAAALGFGGARYVDGGWPFGTGDDGMTEITQQLAAQTETIARLQAQIEGLNTAPDLSGIETAQSEISNRVSVIAADLGGLQARLTELEKRPMTEGVSAGAIAAYQAEMDALRSEIEDMAATAAQSEANAAATAEATLRRAAITRIQTALDTGDSFADPLADLQNAGVDVPESLARAADTGVPSLAALQGTFPDAARAALEVSRRATDDGAGFGGFLKTQLGVRSLEPREGDDPDAVLSRAEAALREGRLTDTLAEIDALPEVGRAELTDWMGQATTRIEAQDAVESLLQSLNDT